MNQIWKPSLYRSARTQLIEEPITFLKFLFYNLPKIPDLLILFEMLSQLIL